MLVLVFCMILRLMDGSGFDWPAALPNDWLQIQGITGAVRYAELVLFETPQQLRITSIESDIMWNCIAVYDPLLLDSLTRQRPIVVATDDIIDAHATEGEILCGIYAFFMVDIYIMPNIKPSAMTFLETYGLDPQYVSVNDNVTICGEFYNGRDETDCLKQVAENYGYIPEIMASIVSYQIINYLKNDGWNQDGDVGTDGTACTANCRAYRDTTNYVPCINDPIRWQPMLEDDGRGFFYHYDHVTPHIGEKAKLKVLTRDELNGRTAPDPEYDYDQEADLVIERLADLAVNDTQKMLVEFFDSKLEVGGLIANTLSSLENFTMDFLDYAILSVGFTHAEHDSMLAAWKEKRNWDRVRPTMVIKRRGNKRIKTYAGPYQGLKRIKAKDFEAYHRVMPHSEYPSGSGCICMAASQFTLKYLQERYGLFYNDDIVFEINFSQGSSKNEPGITPANDISVTVNGFEELYKLCGETRLWGGMHFTAAVTGAFEICDGIAEKSYEYVMGLLNDE